MKSYRFIFVVFAVFVFAGCEEPPQEINNYYGGGEVVVGGIELSFSGNEANVEDSVIDLIRAAAKEGERELSLRLYPMSEQVELNEGTDFGEDGLVLIGDGSDEHNSPSMVTINGGGRTIDLIGFPKSDPLITVGKGVMLILENNTLKGLKQETDNNDKADNNVPVIKVVEGGTLVLKNGAMIKENENLNGDGGGVRIDGGGALIMEIGSEISNNGGKNGGGVYVNLGGRFTMNGGTISDNNSRGVSEDGGGGVYVKGEFAMFSGAISDNTAQSYGGGVCVAGGGMFRLDGGTIIGNKGQAGGGVGLNDPDSVFVMNWGTISGNSSVGGGGSNKVGGGGVFVTGQFMMHSGTISENEATNGGGGGVRIGGDNSGRFTMNTGVISGNKANGVSGDGGGVYLREGNNYFQMIYGSIKGNAANGSGGGVYMKENTIFEMVSGTISGNGFGMSATQPLEIVPGNAGVPRGGGVYVSNGGKFTKLGGATIAGLVAYNTAQWDDYGFQNYFRYAVHRDEENEAVEYGKWKDVNFYGKPGIGYAVYYDRGNGNVYKEDEQNWNRDLCRDRSIVAEDGIEITPDLDPDMDVWRWSENYPGQHENEVSLPNPYVPEEGHE
jgi:hypothetical protein